MVVKRLSMIAVIVALSGCGAALMPAATFVSTAAPTGPELEAVTARQAEADLLSLTPAQKAELKRQVVAWATYANALNAYSRHIESATSENRTLSGGYSWINGLVGGLGGLVTALGSSKSSIPGYTSALWALLGLTIQKGFVDPKIADGVDAKAKIAKVRLTFSTASEAWTALVSAAAADQPAKYAAWQTAYRAALVDALDILGGVPIPLAR